LLLFVVFVIGIVEYRVLV